MKFLYCFIIFALTACGEKANSQTKKTEDQVTVKNNIEAAYWNEGKAEIGVYELIQNRYRNLNSGKLIFVFVTEDFLADRQVKNESYTSSNTVKIIKNIRIRKFTTGIYDYSLHTSVFTPLNRNKYNTLKVTNSMQEWCGTTFRQLNNRNNNYTLQVRSYFEKEGDEEFSLKEATLEDELFNLLKMNPEFLPIGKFRMIPALSFLSLRHVKPEIVEAEGSLNNYSDTLFSEKNLMEYRYEIASQHREIQLIFENKMPFKIVGFTESYPSAFDGKIRTSVAKLVSVQHLPYWQLNSPENEMMRKEIGL